MTARIYQAWYSTFLSDWCTSYCFTLLFTKYCSLPTASFVLYYKLTLNIANLNPFSVSSPKFSLLSWFERRIDNCESSPNYGLTVSFWFRLLKRSQSRFSTSSCENVKNPIVESSASDTSTQGFRVSIRGCKQEAIRVHIRSYSQTWLLTWGNATQESWSKQWSNVIFTFRQSEGITLYFNGEEVKKQTVRDIKLYCI